MTRGGKRVAKLMLKCSGGCGRELTGVVYRVDKGRFGDSPVDHFTENFKFEKRVGFYCFNCYHKRNNKKTD